MLEKTVNLVCFADRSCCQMLRIALSRAGQRFLSPWQGGIVGVKSYRWFSENGPYKKRFPGTIFWTQNSGPKLENLGPSGH